MKKIYCKEDLENLKDSKFIMICSNCNKEIIMSNHGHTKKAYTGICKACKIKQTNLEKYGVTNTFQKPEIKEKREQNCLKKYGSKTNFGTKKFEEQRTKTFLKKYGVKSSLAAKEIREKIKQTNLEKYGVETNLQRQDIKEKIKKTNLEKYGVENIFGNSSYIQKKFEEKYGVSNPSQVPEIQKKIEEKFQKKWKGRLRGSPILSKKISETWKNKTLEEIRSIFIKTSKTRSSLSEINGIKPDSIWEQNFIKTHPDCKRGPCIEYKDKNNKIHYWNIDFEWEGKLYEVKNPFYFNLNHPNWKPELTWEKWKKGEKLNIRWYLWDPLNMNRKFPIKEELELFRNKCFVKENKSPFDAWNDYKLRFRAEENLAQQLGSGGNLLKKLLSGKYKIENLILERFTIAKIAPRVTSMSKQEAKKWLLNSNLDLSRGIYDPCGGFGGRKEACKELNIEYEGYDVNPELIKLVGHTYQDLILMNPIQTNKIVFTSPPWLNKECWPGSNGSITEIHEKEWWYKLIQEKIKAPHYIFVNGSENNLNFRHNGLFGQRNKICIII